MTTSLPPIRRLVLAQVLEARLRTLDGVAVFRGRVPDQPPMLDDNPSRVAPYVVQFSGAGAPVIDGDVDLAGEHDDLRQIHLLHCVAAREDDCLQLVDRVHQLLFRWAPVADGALEGLAFGRMRPPPGYDAGQVRLTGPGVTPARFWLPQQYVLDTTT